MVLASVLLLTFATASVLAVKFSYMSCVPDFRGSPEAGTCPSLLNGNAIQNTTTEELYKSKGCSVVAGCTAFEHPILQIAVIDFFLIFCVPAHHLLNACQQRDGAYSEIKDDHQRAPQPHGWLPSGAQVRRLFAIGFCSYSTLCLCGLGLQYMYASAFNMVRLTSTVIFTSVLNATFLKRRLHAHQAYGLLLVIGTQPLCWPRTRSSCDLMLSDFLPVSALTRTDKHPLHASRPLNCRSKQPECRF